MEGTQEESEVARDWAGSPVEPLGEGSRANIEPVVFDLPPARSAAEALTESVEERRAAHARRAKKFGVPMQPVRELTVLGARRAGVREGFVTGFDVTSREELERRAKRAERFGTKVMPLSGAAEAEEIGEAVASKALERRRKAIPGESVRENVLHLFGVDDLSTFEILRYFSSYGPSWVEWLNDSSCNVAFEDSFSVTRVLRFLALKEPTVAAEGDAMGDDAGDGQSAPAAPEGAEHDGRLEWREAVPIQGREGRFVLWMRIATENDVRPYRPNPKSRWSRTVNRSRTQLLAEDIPPPLPRRSRSSSRHSRFGLTRTTGGRVKKEDMEPKSKNRRKRDRRVTKKEQEHFELDIDKPLSSK